MTGLWNRNVYAVVEQFFRHSYTLTVRDFLRCLAVKNHLYLPRKNFANAGHKHSSSSDEHKNFADGRSTCLVKEKFECKTKHEPV